MRFNVLRALTKASRAIVASPEQAHRPATEVTLAPLFTDQAVLQRDQPVPIWGRAPAGEKITVTFQRRAEETVAAPDGHWLVHLPPMSANGNGEDLTVTGSATVVVREVVVGDVWLCAGQSNMGFTMWGVPDAALEMEAANFPLLRQVTIEPQLADQPMETVPTSGWKKAVAWDVYNFSAIGYYFARDIQQQLDVPVGLISCTMADSEIEAWLGRDAFPARPTFVLARERWQKVMRQSADEIAEYDRVLADWLRAAAVAKAEGAEAYGVYLKQSPKPTVPRGYAWQPAALFDGMINPLLPFALRGVLWYQGESNVDRANEYHALFLKLIASWRTHFGAKELPFYWVGLANYESPKDPTGRAWAFLREAQTRTLLLPQTGQAIAIDMGERDNIHPRNKREVGRRLALLARAKTYGLSGNFMGPTLVGTSREGTALRARFLHAEGGLVSRGESVASLQLAGKERLFHDASAIIEGDTLLISSPLVRDPVAVRYAWTNSPQANLYNRDHLPAGPFRSDAW